jgi:cytochrome c oxidase subunit III
LPDGYTAVVGRMSYHEPGHVAHHFDDAAQQKESAMLGMWAFLGTEVLFFGPLFAAYALYRNMDPKFTEAFLMGSQHLSFWSGTINTGVLLCSSFAMAMAVHSAATGNQKKLATFLVLTIILGTAFLVFKAFEYHAEWQEKLVPALNWSSNFEGETRPPQLQLFFLFYFTMTAIHALHMIIGISIMLVLLRNTLKGRYSAEYHNPIEITGLYWHFVDIVWVFLFPMLYLLRHA